MSISVSFFLASLFLDVILKHLAHLPDLIKAIVDLDINRAERSGQLRNLRLLLVDLLDEGLFLRCHERLHQLGDLVDATFPVVLVATLHLTRLHDDHEHLLLFL